VVSLQRIRKKAGRFILNHKVSNFTRNKEFINLEVAQTIGILFHHIDNESFRTIQKFIKDLTKEKRQIYAIGYIETMEIPDFYLLKRGIDFFCLKDINWYYKPEQGFLQEFTEREFDLLINLSIDDYFPVEYIYALSKARFKIGKHSDNYDYADLSIDTKDNRDIDYLVQQISYYLQTINKKH
jgi:hypothetical protein